ncbi:MAG: DUF805 domain-containing protein [Oscillospiraceae bacterium]|nr:DUF805 domain-containing protein [Oscillospiraceae bacterium]
MRYYFRALGRYFCIEGRASRKELWMFILFDFLFLLGFLCVDFYLGTTFTVDYEVYEPFMFGYIGTFYYLFSLIPGFTLKVRRLHDVNRSGFLWLVTYIPIICIYPYCLIFFAESNPHPNKYGDVPENVRGYQPNVYVNINMNQAHDGKYETSYEKYEEYEPDTQNYSTTSEEYNVHVKRHYAGKQSQDNYVYEENAYSDFEPEAPQKEQASNATCAPESFEDEEPFNETEPSKSALASRSWIVIAVVILLVIGLCFVIDSPGYGKQKQNAGGQKEILELFDTKNTEAQIAEFLSGENAGFASDRFYSDTPLLRISMSDDEATFGIVRIYDTSYHLNVSGDCIEAEWYDYYTRVCVYPKKRGISYINFSNELNDETFQVMVVVE